MIITKKSLLIALAVMGVTAAAVFFARQSASRPTFADAPLKVVVDAGHGEPDGGAVGASGVVEKDVNLAIAKKLAEVLEGRGAVVIMTRGDDSDLHDDNAKTLREMKKSDMNKRKKIIKESGADLFLSIHMNSFSNASVNGLHIFYDREHPETEELAKNIQNGISKVTGAAAHAVKTADEKLFLMKNPPVPSILAECGFLSNPEEEKKLTDEEYQSKIAWAIADEVLEFYDLN